MLQINAVATRTMDLLRIVAAQPCLQNFYLVGGTSLALQIGHRLSYDFDFFSDIKSDMLSIENELLQLPNIKLKSNSSHALFMEIENVKLDVINYPYKFIKEPIVYETIKLAHKDDIVAMKIKTIMNRGAKRDFYDIYFLLQEYTINEMLELFQKKYNNIEPLAIYRSLCYFYDAEEQEDVVLLKQTSLTWKEVKQSIINETKKLI